MNKEKIVNFTGSVLIFFVLLFLFAKFGPALPISVTTQPKGEPLTVSGEGKVAVIPDIAKVTLGIEEGGPSLKSVQASVNQKSKNLTDALKKLGIGEREIKTTAYNVYPEYDFGEALSSAYEVKPLKITGYRVSTSYEIKIKDFDKINEILVKATEVGANLIGNISFEVNEETKNAKLNEAREEAVKQAKAKAEGLARAAGVSLGKILNISEAPTVEPRPIFALEEKVGAGGPIEPEIQPGETELSVSVSLTFEIR